jgi:hypothetical protein
MPLFNCSPVEEQLGCFYHLNNDVVNIHVDITGNMCVRVSSV